MSIKIAPSARISSTSAGFRRHREARSAVAISQRLPLCQINEIATPCGLAMTGRYAPRDDGD
ncbi:MAG: hypothetical protein WD672_14185 [Woeseia sp.]